MKPLRVSTQCWGRLLFAIAIFGIKPGFAPAQVKLVVSPGTIGGGSTSQVSEDTTEIDANANILMAPIAMQGQINPRTDRVLSFSYFSAHSTDHVRLEYKTADGKIRTALLLPGLSHSEGFTDYAEDLSDLDAWSSARSITALGFETVAGNVIRIRNVEIRPSTEAELRAAKERVELAHRDEQLRTDLDLYLTKTFPDKVEDVYCTANTLHISGELADDRDVYLAEVPMYENLTQLKSFDYTTPLHAVNNHFDISLTRVRTLPDHTYDRILSKWVVIRRQGDTITLLSHAHFADEVASKWSFPDEVPRSKKGLGGFTASGPLDDIEKLGITSVTVNLFLDFLRPGPGADRTEFSYGGRVYYADSASIANYDRTLEYAATHKLIVSAILLVPKHSAAANGTPAAQLAFPYADPAGIYAMPNVGSAEGLQVYAAMLNFLAERYSRPDEKFGRIHHWIVHNEVDAGWVWTNAGNKSELTFMDMYIKSMRTVFLIARQYNPHARVYISLTHYWNQTEDKHFYLPHRMLDELVDFSHAEGDFDWSIAYHPYPESLFKPRTWEDTRATFDMNTPLITFKNIEVLDAWTMQPRTFYRGQKPRSIFLSEQGFNSEDYSQKSLTDQAAGLAYAWKKIETMDSIEAMQYHNWIDNRGEGGLRIGLRKFRDESEDPLGKKPIWYLYQGVGTPQEDAACEPYLKVINVPDWDAVRFKGQIVGAPPESTLRNMKSDQWAATDALGRELPSNGETGGPRPGRFVGIFYFLTADQSGVRGPRDVTKSLQEGQDTSKWTNGTYYWGEPEAGYYLATDEWVIRRNAQLLADAGVDVIIFDATNDVTYPKTYMKILGVYERMRAEGEKTPQIAFLASQRSVRELWTDFYSKGLYRNLWFNWKGKPLLLTGQQRGMVPVSQMSAEFRNFFTLRESWAWDSLPWYRDGHDQWPWIAHTPQAYGWHEGPNRPEEMPVAVAEHPLSAIGRSFHNGTEPPLDSHDLTASTNQGLYFQEQWDHAIAVDPEFVFVTGWNEWTAGSMTMGIDVDKSLAAWDFYPGAKLGRAGHPILPGDVYFIDQYNQEFSRDIEPMKGGHSDDYYYQLVANIRRYKGIHHPEPASVAQTIDLNNGFEQWDTVTPEFEDHGFDTLPRASEGNYAAGPYKDNSGRNDFLSMKVARDQRFVYFYAKTHEPITNSRGSHWMLLFINTHQAGVGNWQGYDLVVNAKVINHGKTTVMQVSGHDLSVPVTVPMRVDGNQLMIAIPRAVLKQPAGRISLDFHWADNIAQYGDITEFLMHGDNAPDRRARYRYEVTDEPNFR